MLSYPLGIAATGCLQNWVKERVEGLRTGKTALLGAQDPIEPL